jgi:hypothetical protein
MEPFNQALTKHLYRIDEVLSSLRWSIITHNLTETAFWTLELYESNMMQECIELLEKVWIQHIGFGSWFSLRLIQEVYDSGEISQWNLISLSCAFAKRRVCDSTIFHLLLRGATNNNEPRFAHSMEYQNLNEAISDCIKRGKLKEAWLLGRSMKPSEQWALLDSLCLENRKEALEIIKTLGSSIYEQLAAAYVLVSLDECTWLSSQQPIENTVPSEVLEAMNDWSKEKMRKRRVFKPKPEALLYLTARSQQYSSEADIQVDLLKTLKSSEYWSTILESYMANEKWISDKHKEAFFDTFFPQDIPDEWSLADREKSHGRGLGKTIEQARTRFIYYTILKSKSLELWNSVFPEIDCSMEWDSIYSEFKETINFPMKPIKKVFEVV